MNPFSGQQTFGINTVTSEINVPLQRCTSQLIKLTFKVNFKSLLKNILSTLKNTFLSFKNAMMLMHK